MISLNSYIRSQDREITETNRVGNIFGNIFFYCTEVFNY